MDMSEPDGVANGRLLVPGAGAKQCCTCVQARSTGRARPWSEWSGRVAAGKMIQWVSFKPPNCINRGDKISVIPALLLDSRRQAVKCPAGSGDVVRG